MQETQLLTDVLRAVVLAEQKKKIRTDHRLKPVASCYGYKPDWTAAGRCEAGRGMDAEYQFAAHF